AATRSATRARSTSWRSVTWTTRSPAVNGRHAPTSSTSSTSPSEESEQLEMERELLITGIGGQGIQLAAQVVAKAATVEGGSVMFFGIYGGMMRGGNTDSTVVVADAPIEAPPVVSHAWSAIAMHDEFWAPLESKLRPGGLVLVNESTFAHE